MAKKTKKKKSPTRRRRRVGAAGGNDLMMTIVGGVGGAVVGKLVTKLATKSLPSMNANMLKWGTTAVQILGGYMLTKKSAPGLMKGVGIGLAINGGLQVVSIVMPSIGRIPVMIPTRGGMVGGFRDVPRLGAAPYNSGVTATPNGGFPRPARVSGLVNFDKAAMAGGLY